MKFTWIERLRWNVARHIVNWCVNFLMPHSRARTELLSLLWYWRHHVYVTIGKPDPHVTEMLDIICDAASDRDDIVMAVDTLRVMLARPVVGSQEESQE